MVGMVIFKHSGKTDFYLNGHHIKSGYILIQKTSAIINDPCTLGQVHGKLYHSFFNETPQACTVVEGFGFAVQNKQWKFTSRTLNEVLNSVVPDSIAKEIQNAIELYWKTANKSC